MGGGGGGWRRRVSLLSNVLFINCCMLYSEKMFI